MAVIASKTCIACTTSSAPQYEIHDEWKQSLRHAVPYEPLCGKHAVLGQERLLGHLRNIHNDTSWVGVLVNRWDNLKRVQIVAPNINNEKLRPTDDQYKLLIEHESYHTRALRGTLAEGLSCSGGCQWKHGRGARE